MIIHKTPKEEKSLNLNVKLNNVDNVLTLARQALYFYLTNSDEKFILLPRYLAAGVYMPVNKAQKKVVYYDLNDKLEIDLDSLNLKNFDSKDTIFYYIHHFGLYIDKNIETLKNIKSMGFKVIDDRALTLPYSQYNEFADATLYSIYKSVGISYGAFINSDKVISYNTNCDDLKLQQLQYKMQQNLDFYGSNYLQYLPMLIYRIINKIIGKGLNYNGFVDEVWDITAAKVNSSIINSINFEDLSLKRIELAKIYIENLNSSFLLPVDISSYSKQSLIGFPIYVANPKVVYKKLLKKGIQCFTLTNGWWFDNGVNPWNIYSKHLILPLHIKLDKKRIIKVCNEINKIFM